MRLADGCNSPTTPTYAQGDACLAGISGTVSDAARCALTGQGPRIMAGLRVRIGINTGEVQGQKPLGVCYLGKGGLLLGNFTLFGSHCPLPG
jgi:class 3 adenylate cyclase